jgi:hypothetical protein
MNIGHGISAKFDGSKTFAVTKKDEDGGAVLSWIQEAGLTKVTTELCLSISAIEATVYVLAEYAKRIADEKSVVREENNHG